MDDLAARVQAHPGWYHTISLTEGVETPGMCDLRPFAPTALPASLAGRRCLDVGTFDGFWAFELESRGPDEVLALDLPDISEADVPPNTREEIIASRDPSLEWGAGFRLAHEARDSQVRRITGNVYGLCLDWLDGTPVDVVLCGTLLQHLRDPVAALERMRDVLAPGGELLLIESYSLPLTRRHKRRAVGEFRPAVPGSLYTWWVPNLEALKAWAVSAGFEQIPGRESHHTPLRGAGPEDRLVSLAFRPAGR